MNLRYWIIGCALGCFAAGTVVGLVAPEVAAAWAGDDGPRDPDVDYARKLAADFGLDRSQRLALQVVLERYRREELQVYRHANFEQLPANLQAELTAARRRQADRIYALLDDEQRARYDEWTRAGGSVR